MTRSASIVLGDILEAAELLQRYTSGLTYDAFALDIEKQDAVCRRLEIIGEAVRALPREIRDSYPSTPWREISAARDILIHEYFRIDLGLAWEMVQRDVPALADQVRAILADLGDV